MPEGTDPEKRQNPGLERLIKMNKARANFKSDDELINAFECYLCKAEDKFKTQPPSFSRFADYAKVSRSSVIGALERFPRADAICRKMLADVLVEQGLVGNYRDSTTIFTLKNVAGWTDKRETTNTTKGLGAIATPDEARENVKKIKESLGFDDRGRPSKEAERNMDKMEDRIIQLAEAKAM